MTIMDNHHLAMELADKADRAKRLGKIDEAKKFFQEAFQLESSVALKFQDRTTIEPTRSVFFRSAASLAMECEEYREAEKMIAFGLSGSPPEEIAEELRDLLEQVNFERHLMLRGIKLSPNELQFSIWGPDIGPGFAQSREFIERVEKIEILSFRTLERMINKPFREAGRPAKEVTDKFNVYLSVPRAASFAITIRLAGDQKYLPGLDLGIDVASEIVECFDLLNNHKDQELKTRIEDKAYFDNFVSISKQIAPDGKRVTHVGLTLQTETEEKKVKFDRKKTDWDAISNNVEVKTENERVEIQGNLRFADATTKKLGMIELVDTENPVHKYKIKVPLGMMADIVRPMFEYDVIVKGIKDKKGFILLEDIIRANDD